jgi:hypothetical protein
MKPVNLNDMIIGKYYLVQKKSNPAWREKGKFIGRSGYMAKFESLIGFGNTRSTSPVTGFHADNPIRPRYLGRGSVSFTFYESLKNNAIIAADERQIMKATAAIIDDNTNTNIGTSYYSLPSSSNHYNAVHYLINFFID